MDISALKFGIFATFVILIGWKAVRGLVATEIVVRNRAYGEVATKPFKSVVVALLMAIVSFGGYWFANFSYLWLAVAIMNMFVAFLVFGQSHLHDRGAAMDAELALAIDRVQMAAKIRARRWESIGQVAIILVWAYAWHDVLEIT
jgi:hypothetical protein